ncbi:MAG: AAA family ATPase [Atopobiaceae bacterium]|nr:AAA family ATPase [Atopobiaceae bacterium]
MNKSNPFTPAFGSLPQMFFGRKRELEFASEAMDNPNSPHRAFFITGNRGCGKTTLLERISRTAAERKWNTVDVHSAYAVQSIIEELAGGGQKTVTKEASPSALGVRAGSISSTTTSSYSEASLARLLAEKCEGLTLRKGILITVDEIQKVPESDAEAICAAVQLSLHKGLPVMLVLAGLPGSKEQVASYPGCTFMQRTYDMQIGSLGVDETLDALDAAFALVPALQLSKDAFWRIGLFSQGHPYLMQLAGYYLVERFADRALGGVLAISTDDVASIESVALESYRANVLAPVLDALPESLSTYLRAMCEAEDSEGRIATGDVARLLGKTPQQVSSYRQRLIDKRLIEPDGKGYARVLLPHIQDYFAYERELPASNPENKWNRYR